MTPAVALKKAAVETLTVSRFVLPDLASMKYKWVVDKLGKRWPNHGERGLYGFLRGCSESKEFYFVKTEHAVGLANIARRLLDPSPYVQEIFVYIDDVKNQRSVFEGAAVYAEFRTWGKSHGASEVILDRYSEVPRNAIEEAIGSVAKREEYFSRIGA